MGIDWDNKWVNYLYVRLLLLEDYFEHRYVKIFSWSLPPLVMAIGYTLNFGVEEVEHGRDLGVDSVLARVFFNHWLFQCANA